MKRPEEWPAPDEYMYDTIVFIGRFEPPTTAHIETISYALQYAKNVLVLAGSANQPRTIKNPWTVDERREMILACFPDEANRIQMIGIEDHIYNDNMWLRDVQRAVNDVDWSLPTTQKKIGIIGHSKDDSSYYLQMFPQWDPLEMDNIDDINATDVREIYLNPLWTLVGGGSKFETNVKDKLPAAVGDYLMKFKDTEAYVQLAEEYEFINRYKLQWANVPYDVNFTTTDAVVVQSGHVLLIQRRANPGKNLWALPGGFLQKGKRLQDSMISELREETKLNVPVKVLVGNIKGIEVFDHENRSLRGRTITHAYYITLPPGPLSKVKGSDDAKKARWVPVAEALEMGDQLFEDHIHILRHFIGEA